MIVTLDGFPAVHERFSSDAELARQYRDYEAEQGRIVPSFDVTVLLAVAGGFLLQYAAEKTLDALLERREKKRQREADAAREKQIDEKLEAISDQLEELKKRSMSAETAADVFSTLSQAGIDLKLELETPTEFQLQESIRERLPDNEMLRE